MTKVRASIGVLAALVIVCGSAVGCGSVSDQTKQEAKEEVEQRAQQARKWPRIWTSYALIYEATLHGLESEILLANFREALHTKLAESFFHAVG
jgi:hypothetical protein